MNRRKFIKNAVVFGILSPNSGLLAFKSIFSSTIKFSVKTLTQGPKHHFFGYYGICPWNKSEKYLLALENPFQDHMPKPNESANIGLVDAVSGKFEKITETLAWNFQQGAMLHWNPINPENEIIFNDREGDQIVSKILNINTGKERTLPRPVNGVSHNGKHALSLTYGRLGRLRKVVGYEAAVDPYPNDPHPENDGVFVMNLETGETNLAVSINRVHQLLVKNHPGLTELNERHLWFNHVVFNKSDSRFFFLARTRKPNGNLETGMCTINTNGSDLVEVIPYGSSVSHFDWRNNEEIIATFQAKGDKGRKHYLFKDRTQNYKQIGKGFLDGDGHCTFGPNPDWLVTDPGDEKVKNARSLRLYNIKTDERIVLGVFPLDKFRSGNLRCDLHPRWNRTGNEICFDAIEQKNGTRQLHLASLKGI